MPDVLIVDDEERLLRVLRLGLKGSAWTMRSAANGEEALKMIFDQPPDLLVTDIRMPVMGGVDLLYEMERYGMDIPAVVMTAHADTDSAVKSFRHGARDYITKPFTVDELVRVMEGVLARSGPRKASVAPSAGLREAVEAREKEVILEALRACGDNKTAAARRLGIAERTLWYKVRKYGF